MGNLFRRIFNPTKEEQIQDLEQLIRLHNMQIGHCSTCIHHEESRMPGFVTDYGKCKKRVRIFYKKVVDSSQHIPCKQYEEDAEYVQLLKKQIQLLKTEYPPVNDTFPEKE